VLVGAAVGLAAAAAAGSLMSPFLFRVRPVEPAVLAGAAAVLGIVALVAGLVPALRAARVDPVTALRED
jgi:putative ABC transport system permease protein